MDAVTWAAEQEIVLGYEDGRFGPDDPITREQLAAVLYRYAASRGMDLGSNVYRLGGFADEKEIASYALIPMNWAVELGLLQGDGSRLSPKATATRAQTAAILARFCEK